MRISKTRPWQRIEAGARKRYLEKVDSTDDWQGCPIVQMDPERMHGEPTLRHYRVPVEDVRTIFAYLRKNEASLIPF